MFIQIKDFIFNKDEIIFIKIEKRIDTDKSSISKEQIETNNTKDIFQSVLKVELKNIKDPIIIPGNINDLNYICLPENKI